MKDVMAWALCDETGPLYLNGDEDQFLLFRKRPPMHWLKQMPWWRIGDRIARIKITEIKAPK